MSKLSLWIQNLCTNTEHKFKEKKTPTKIKQVSTKNKNTSAKFSKETQAHILIRDKHCIWCWKWIQQFHHVYFGTEANHWTNRNDVDQWVGVCSDCHILVHWCKQWEWLRQDFINYLNSIYG